RCGRHRLACREQFPGGVRPAGDVIMLPRLTPLWLTACLLLAGGRPPSAGPPGADGKKPADGGKKARTDRHGDPLPPGAVLRLGTIRLRHTAAVTSLSFAPDGRRLVAGSRNQTVHVWETATGRELVRWETATGREMLQAEGELGVSAVAFSPRADRVATGGHQGAVCLWDASTGKLRKRLGKHGSFVTQVAFSPDGRTLVTGSSDERLHFWDVATGGLRRDRRPHFIPPPAAWAARAPRAAAPHR